MVEAVPTLPRVFLGEALKQLRADAGKSLDECAAVVGKDRARLVKVLDGKSTLSAEELAALLDFLGVKRVQRKEIMTLGLDTRKRATGAPYLDLAPGSWRRIALLEALASEVWSYDKGIFPYLVQAPEYVHALMDISDGIWWDTDETERANKAEFRLERQRAVLEADKPKTVDLFFTDDALLTEVGGPGVMRAQLAHLLRLVDERKNVTVRIVPCAAPDNPAQYGGITVFHFGDLLRPVGFLPVAYGPSAYFDKAHDTERLTRALNKIREIAYSPRQTKKILAARLEELTRGQS
ncbi:helix-turn-helix domain-containing protein [Solihabitans fulvus]|uniref:Helix-turn-helix domain-containing protein n=1 Tax=Solihabitans fulvus TaxID=1892852 RepID=A0A5B2WIH4_9PSEU|nr:helix-turn-helix transcriptional regulator [Solihabitans fulvus]KAA2250139.1 helix-turn-helix domain-containing protein [Solihabitans fulvus]